MLKDLLETILQQEKKVSASLESFNSQVGAALSLLAIKDDDEIALIEVGISKEHEMERQVRMIRPDHAILTTIGCAHLATLHSKETIIREKIKLLQSVPNGNFCLAPLLVKPYLAAHSSVQYWDENAPFRLSYVTDLITLASKTAELLGIAQGSVTTALKNYSPEPMRIELWQTSNNATVINDTYIADPMSCDSAFKQLHAFSQPTSRKIFLFGGFRKQQQNEQMALERVAHSIKHYKIDDLLLSDHPKFDTLKNCLKTLSPNTIVHRETSDQALFEKAAALLQPSDVMVIKWPRKRAVHELITKIEGSPPNNQVIINLAAIQANLEAIRKKIGPNKRLMVVAKALAYGTDDVRLSKFLPSVGIDIIGLSYVDEGVQMRKAGITQDLFVLNAAPYEAAKAVKWNLEVAVYDLTLIKLFEEEARLQNKVVKMHLHIDTGMCRFGARGGDITAIAEYIHKSPYLILEGLMTHLAVADDPDEDAFTHTQIARLKATLNQLHAMNIFPNHVHAANSSGAIRFDLPFCNMVRVGLAAYGLHTSPATRDLIDLKPAISLVSRIVGFNYPLPGDTVSYGRRFAISRENARIAVLPIGYYDGLHRHYSMKSSVLIRGQKAPMVGTICMDYMMVDVSHIPEAAIGDTALIFGEDEEGKYLPPEELAAAGNSVPHELITCLGPRIRRLFIYDEALRPR